MKTILIVFSLLIIAMPFVSAELVHYFYNLQGDVVAEIDSSGHLIKEYRPMPDEVDLVKSSIDNIVIPDMEIDQIEMVEDNNAESFRYLQIPLKNPVYQKDPRLLSFFDSYPMNYHLAGLRGVYGNAAYHFEPGFTRESPSVEDLLSQAPMSSRFSVFQ